MIFKLWVTALTVTMMSLTALACDLDNDLVSKYCQASVVFKGVPTSGVSGVSYGPNGEQIEHGRFTFQVVTYYKNHPGQQPDTVDVSRIYTATDGCDSSFLPEAQDDYLILASGDEYLQVPPCGHVIPFECAPSNLREITC